MQTHLHNLSSEMRLYSLGAIAFFLSAFCVPFGMSYPASYDPIDFPCEAAWEYLSFHYQMAFLALFIGFLSWIIGICVLQYYLVSQYPKERKSITIALILSLIGLTVILTQIATQGFALPEYAQAYVLVDQSSIFAFRISNRWSAG
jgi:hypothetical protein